MTQHTKPRRLLPVITHYALALLIISMMIGGAMAAGEPDDKPADKPADEQTLTLYTDDDLKDAQELLFGSGVTELFAILRTLVWIVPIGVVAILCVLAVAARLSNNAELFSSAIKGIFAVVGIVLLMGIALGLISSLTPDFSTIAVGG